MKDLYTYLGVQEADLKHLLDNKNRYYVTYSVPKRNSKGKRIISAPQDKLKEVQRLILNKILYQFKPSEICHGFVRGRGPRSNAACHTGKDWIISFDLADCFPSISVTMVARCLGYLSFSLKKRNICEITNEQVELLAGLMTYKGVLAQGLPTSPAMLNLVLKKFDLKLKIFADAAKIDVTRYADDITFSSNKIKLSPSIKAHISTVLSGYCREFGLTLNNKKYTAKKSSARMKVTGVVANQKPNLAANEYKVLRARIHNFYTGKTSLTEKQIQQLRGKLEWLRQLNPAKADPLIKKFAKTLLSKP